MANYSTLLPERANTTIKWIFEGEELQYYQFIEKGIIKATDDHNINYKFNSEGYRCDNFTDQSELPVVFLGCSMTEGIGVKFENLWRSRVLSRIRTITGKKIPHWSLALAGAGIDDQSRRLYEFSQRVNIKHVYALFPPMHRREYKYDGNDYRLWTGSANSSRIINHVFVDRDFSEYQTQRSLMILDSLRQALNFKITATLWGNRVEDEKIYKNFPNIKFFTPLYSFPDLSRDQCHHGPIYHATLAEHMWENSKENYD